MQAEFIQFIVGFKCKRTFCLARCPNNRMSRDTVLPVILHPAKTGLIRVFAGQSVVNQGSKAYSGGQ